MRSYRKVGRIAYSDIKAEYFIDGEKVYYRIFWNLYWLKAG